MAWLVVAGGATGVLLGLLLVRVHIIVVVSIALAALSVTIAILYGWSALFSVAFMFALLGALQGGYVGGMGLAFARARSKAPHAILRSTHIDQ